VTPRRRSRPPCRWPRARTSPAPPVEQATIGQIEKIQKTATPELVEAVRAGTISINAAATVASLPEERNWRRSPAARRNCRRPPRKCANCAPPRVRPRSRRRPGTGQRLQRHATDVRNCAAENAALREKNAALLEKSPSSADLLELTATGAYMRDCTLHVLCCNERGGGSAPAPVAPVAKRCG
jgi:hypothetical protein